MTSSRVDAVIATLCSGAGLAPPASRHPIQTWPLSTVERVRLLDGSTVICKYAQWPFTAEARVLRAAANRAVPVPAVLAATALDGTEVMLLEDLGDPIAQPTDRLGATAAARLHRARLPVDGLERWDGPALAGLPDTMFELLRQLDADGRLHIADDVVRILTDLARHAAALAAGAETPPFGFVHGELHPTSLHLGTSGWRLLDLGMASPGRESSTSPPGREHGSLQTPDGYEHRSTPTSPTVAPGAPGPGAVAFPRNAGHSAGTGSGAPTGSYASSPPGRTDSDSHMQKTSYTGRSGVPVTCCAPSLAAR